MQDTSDRYRRLVELSPDGILISQASRIVFLNPAAARLFGADDTDQVVGKSLFDVFHPDSHALVYERLEQLLARAVGAAGRREDRAAGRSQPRTSR